MQVFFYTNIFSEAGLLPEGTKQARSPKLSSEVRPELVDKIESCVTGQIKSDPAEDGIHSLPLSGHVEVAQRL